MSEDEQDKIVGRMVRERRDAIVRLEQLKAEAKRIGASLVTLGNALSGYPEHLSVEGRPLDPRFPMTPQRQSWSGKLESAERIVELTNAIRDEIARIDELNESLGKMGMK